MPILGFQWCVTSSRMRVFKRKNTKYFKFPRSKTLDPQIPKISPALSKPEPKRMAADYHSLSWFPVITAQLGLKSSMARFSIHFSYAGRLFRLFAFFVHSCLPACTAEWPSLACLEHSIQGPPEKKRTQTRTVGRRVRTLGLNNKGNLPYHWGTNSIYL